MRKYINIWQTFFSNSLTRDMEFKANFISNIGVDLIYYISLYLFYHVIFQFTDSIGTFEKDVVIIFLIVTYMVDSFFEFLFALGGSSTTSGADLDCVPTCRQETISQYRQHWQRVCVCVLC